MRPLFGIYFLPTIIVNLGYVFAFLFQFILVRALTVSEVGAFNASLSLVNIVMAPASIVVLALSRAVARALANGPGEVRVIVERSTMIGLTAATAIVAIGSAAARPLGHLVRVEDTATLILVLILLAGSLLHLLAAGWLQGVMRYVAAAVMLAGMPTLRFLFGIPLLMLFGGGVDGALLAAAAPGIVLFAVGILTMRNSSPRASPARAAWRGFTRFVIVGVPATLFMFSFWNIDVCWFARCFRRRTRASMLWPPGSDAFLFYRPQEWPTFCFQKLCAQASPPLILTTRRCDPWLTRWPSPQRSASQRPLHWRC